MAERGKRLAQSVIDKLCDLHDAGDDYPEIAEKLGLSVSTVRRYVRKRAGIPAPPPPVPIGVPGYLTDPAFVAEDLIHTPDYVAGSPDQIEARKALIRDSWTDSQERQRRDAPPAGDDHVEIQTTSVLGVPGCSMAQMGPLPPPGSGDEE